MTKNNSTGPRWAQRLRRFWAKHHPMEQFNAVQAWRETGGYSQSPAPAAVAPTPAQPASTANLTMSQRLRQFWAERHQAQKFDAFQAAREMRGEPSAPTPAATATAPTPAAVAPTPAKRTFASAGDEFVFLIADNTGDAKPVGTAAARLKVLSDFAAGMNRAESGGWPKGVVSVREFTIRAARHAQDDAKRGVKYAEQRALNAILSNANALLN